MYESVAQACRAAPLGDEDVRKCRPSVPCCTLGRRKSAKVLPKRAVLHPRATKMYESVAQACRAALLGDDKCGFRRRRVSFIHTSFCPAPLGDEDVRKCCPSVPCCTLGRRRCTKVLPKRAVLHPWATIKHESVAQACRAALLGDDKCGFRRRRVPFILRHSALRPWATGRRGRVARLCRASPSGAGQSDVIVPGELGAASSSCRWRGSGGRSHGRAAIISAIISGIFV